MATESVPDHSQPSFHDLIGALVGSYERLVVARDAFVASVHDDRSLPASAEMSQDNPVISRDAISAEWGRLMRLPAGHPPRPAGVVCASAATVARSVEFDQEKLGFAQAVAAIRSALNVQKVGFDRVLQSAAHKTHERSDEWKTVLSRAGLAELDLLHMYAPICRQPASLESLSFTWSSRHRMVYRVTADQAQAEARALPEDARARVEKILGRYRGQDFARPTKERSIRRVNAVYRQNGERTRRTIAPTLFLLERDTLPEILFRPEPLNAARLGREDRRISREPVVRELGLHAYY